MNGIGRNITRGAAILVIAGLIPLVAATPAFAARQKSIRINDASVIEGDTGQKTMTFTISWTGAKGGAAPSVHYTTANRGSGVGYATAGADYTATSGTASMTNSGCRCATVNVPILGDLINEGTETFVVKLSSPVGGTIARAQGIGTVYDNDGPPSIVVTDVSGLEASGSLTFDVLLTSATVGTVTVDYTTSDGAALAGSDYTATSGTLTFTPGQTSKPIPVTIVNDALAEDDETFTLNLSNATGGIAIADPQGVGTIVNDDLDPTVSVGNASVVEGDIGTTTLSLPVTLSGPSGREVDVDYATSDGTATAGSDYTATSGTLVFAAGDTSKQIAVTVNGDLLVEGNETFTVTLSAPFNADLGTTVATGTITNDDANPKLVVGDATVLEGNSGTTPLTFTVAMVPVSVTDVTVDYATSGGTATAGSDYTGTSGTLTIPAGQASGTITVSVIGEKTYEPNETLGLTLSNPVGATIVAGTATGTILNDDRIPTTLSTKLAKGTTAIKAKGAIEAATSGMKIKVSLLHKVGRKYVVVSSKTVSAKGLLDRNKDGILDAAYVASFKRPARGTYRFVTRFAGNATYAPSKRTLSFKL
jgi:Calx-beta domain-containing protein